MTKNFFAFFFFCLSCFYGFSQDVHLSQYYTNQQNLNPATSGMYEGRNRLVVNHRSQWGQLSSTPLTTSIAAFDQKIYFKGDEINAGILVLRDQFQDFGFNTDKIHLTSSYEKFYRGHELRGGIQLGFTLKNTDFSKQTFPNQWVYQEGEFDQSLSNMEDGLAESQNFFDLNLGLAWSKDYGKIKPKGGLAVFHVNNPKDSYFNDSEARLALRYVLHAAAEIQLLSDLSLTPQLLYMRARTAQDMMIGGKIEKQLMNMGDLQHVFAGIQYRDGFGRNADAVIPLAGLAYKNVEVGISYDFNVSELSSYGGNKSTFEISLIYTAPEFIPNKMTLPCDRF
ncbi:MAG: PorP/SprF family type IX secretion system membrane protein [Vicingaceae bacterium]